ncbi:MAG: hypothetical protein IAE82_07875 [Opitutaceae bacterium]|nr:hypothetical protein [Opitutaceae bacterium]
MKDMVTGLAEQSNLLKGDAYGAISTVRRAFGAGAERDHPAGAFLRSDRRLWFWTALASGQPEAIEAALKLPTRAVADAAAVLAERVGQPGFDSVFRRIETVAPQAWRVVDAALAKHEGGRDRQFIRKVLASGLFMGAADALVGVGNDRVLTEAAGWFSGALEIECEDASPDPRCIAIPSLLVAGRVEEAGRLWERASGRVAKPVLAGALWRVFGAWLPVIESGGVVPESVVLWLVNRVRELQGDEKWTALLALLASCLGLYGWDKQHERRSWAGLHLDKGVAPATSGAFALFCWLRQDLECGRRVLDAIGEAWPTTPDEQFPIFCAMALFAPERARVWRAHFTEPDASFLARGTPAHTRCFFWSLALAAMGDGQRADALWQQALQDDPLSRVRAHHRMRLISEGRPGVLRSTLES